MKKGAGIFPAPLNTPSIVLVLLVFAAILILVVLVFILALLLILILVLILIFVFVLVLVLIAVFHDLASPCISLGYRNSMMQRSAVYSIILKSVFNFMIDPEKKRAQ